MDYISTILVAILTLHHITACCCLWGSPQAGATETVILGKKFTNKKLV
jgi:hypothetical protein